jgi:two-component system chemotaxis response regulator CheB
MTPRRVVVVDDSPTMRALIRNALSAHPGLEVVGEAGDPIEARDIIKALSPDVITLDVEMPNMNGLEFLDRLMRLRPMPVVMVSTLTQRGADATLAALELGAVDCVGKPSSGGPAAFGTLADVVAAAAEANVTARIETPARTKADDDYRPGNRIVSIGSSTGGVEALSTVLAGFPRHCPPTLITQHMPAAFTASFAARLDRNCAPTVVEASDGDIVQPGHVYLAPGGARHLTVRRLGERLALRLVEGDLVSGHRPSVDALFHSVAEAVGPRAVGAILTGMGRDGAEGLLAMRRAGAATIGQDESTCIVFGMPRVAAEIGAVERQLPLSRIAPSILNLTRQTLSGAA